MIMWDEQALTMRRDVCRSLLSMKVEDVAYSLRAVANAERAEDT